MERYDLPAGIIKACAGIVQSADTEPYLSAIITAESAIGRTYAKAAEGKRRQLVEAVKLNLVNRKEYPIEQLRGRYGFVESERQFLREKRKFCYTMARELDLI